MQMEVEEDEERRKKVMVAIDERAESYWALLWALDNLRDTILSGHLIIFAAEPPPNYINIFAASLSSARLYSTVNSTADFVNSRQEIEKKVAVGILEKAKSICTSRGIRAVETVLEEGDGKEAICDAVEKHGISLVVLAEHRISRLQAALRWSVSDYCVEYAKCPVLVVKNPHSITRSASLPHTLLS